MFGNYLNHAVHYAHYFRFLWRHHPGIFHYFRQHHRLAVRIYKPFRPLTKLLALFDVGLRFAPPNKSKISMRYKFSLDAIQHLLGSGICQ
ncbi:hypothetical protein F6A94_18560 [Salmonella enterica]|nr:hypothetical protein [Salmonella enterica]